jgi:hypothetical protein
MVTSNFMPFFNASLEASAVIGQHRRLWSDSSGTSITLLVKLKLPLFVVIFVSWASLYLVKLLCGCCFRALQEVKVAGSCMR